MLEDSRAATYHHIDRRRVAVPTAPRSAVPQARHLSAAQKTLRILDAKMRHSERADLDEQPGGWA